VDVSLTDEQLEWQDAVARLAATHATTGADTIELSEDQGWASVVELGIPALRSPELSGVDAAGVESALAVEQAGRSLTTVPIAGQAVFAPELLAAAGAHEALAAVAEGALRVAPALRADLADLAVLGEPAVAFDAAGATHALLLTDDPEDRRVVAVELSRNDVDGLDLTRRLVSIATDAATVSLDLGGTISPERLDRARAVAMTAIAADLLGVMSSAVEEAVRYALDRHQFGTPIGGFQAVQHLLADAAVAVEGARGCVWHAAWASDHEAVDDALLAARTAKAYASAAGLRVVETSVQVFGGIAITWEHLSHLRLRRVYLDRLAFGDEHVHHRAIASFRIDADRVA
jgi:hypothetical protein